MKDTSMVLLYAVSTVMADVMRGIDNTIHKQEREIDEDSLRDKCDMTILNILRSKEEQK